MKHVLRIFSGYWLMLIILVVRDGNIIKQGKHDELLKKNGFYAELYNSQFAE